MILYIAAIVRSRRRSYVKGVILMSFDVIELVVVVDNLLWPSERQVSWQ